MKDADIFDDFSLSTFVVFRHKSLTTCVRKFFIIALEKKTKQNKKNNFSEYLDYGGS